MEGTLRKKQFSKFSANLFSAVFSTGSPALNKMGGMFSSPSNTQDGDEVIETFACNVNDMEDGEMREIEMNEDKNKALLVRSEGEYFAIGPKCTHYGAPLIKGALRNGRVRCPWHGACFNIKTGDIEDYPGLDCVPKHEIVIKDGCNVVIRANKASLQSHKRVKQMVSPSLYR